MVHALQAARRVLRPDGVLANIQPERFDARVDVVSRSGLTPAGRFVNAAFERYLIAAESALSRVVKAGDFTLLAARRHRYHVPLQSLTALHEYIQLLGTPRPRLSPGTWPRLRALWRARPAGARIQITDGFVITVLRKTGP